MDRRSTSNGHLVIGRVFDFVELPGFSDDCERLGWSDDDLREIQNQIMVNPLAHPVSPGTGGLRKMRFAPLKSAAGKRGGARVCYAVFQELSIVLLVIAYRKGEKDSLTRKEKSAIKRILERCERDLAGRSSRRKPS